MINGQDTVVICYAVHACVRRLPDAGNPCQYEAKELVKSQVPEVDKTKYKNDYKAALLAHSFEWAFVMMLPILYNIYYRLWGFDRYSILTGSAYIVLLIWNTAIHYEIDDAKANKKQLNLKEDQLLHVGQVVFTWLAFIIVVKDFY